MMISFLKHARTLFVAVIVFAIPAYAIFSLVAGFTRSANVAIAGEDDPIRNGLNIVNRRAYRPQADASKAGQSDVVLLEDFVFTDKTNQSPYN
jgi:hypothetical protein